jgi:hypothetical protein
MRQDVLLGAQSIARLRRAGETGAFPSLSETTDLETDTWLTNERRERRGV